MPHPLLQGLSHPGAPPRYHKEIRLSRTKAPIFNGIRNNKGRENRLLCACLPQHCVTWKPPQVHRGPIPTQQLAAILEGRDARPIVYGGIIVKVERFDVSATDAVVAGMQLML